MPQDIFGDIRQGVGLLTSEIQSLGGLREELPSDPGAAAIGALQAKTGNVALFAPRDSAIAQGPAPSVRPVGPAPSMRPAAALAVAKAREAGIPTEFQPRFGTLYGDDYEARVNASAMSPEQKQKALDMYRQAKTSTGMGITEEGMRIPHRAEQALGAIGQERSAMEAELSERAMRAQEEAVSRIEQDEATFRQQKREMEAELVGRRQEMDGLRTEIAATKIDPQNYFSNQPTWSKVLSLISVGIGGFASGYSGGRIQNTALQQLNAAIDRDIDAQRANLATKKSALAESQSLYGMARQKLGDDQQAFLFAKSRQLEKASDAAARLAAEGRTENIRLQAREMSTKLKAMSDATENQILGMHFNDYAKRQEIERQRAAAQAFASSPAGRAMAAASVEERARKERMKELRGIAEERKLEAEIVKSGREISGEPDAKTAADVASRVVTLGAQGQEQFLAPTAKIAEELVTRQAAATDFSRTVDSLIAASKTGYLPGGLTATSKEINALHATAASQLARAQAGGRTTEQDEQRAASILPKPAAVMDTGEMQTYRALARQAQGNVEAFRQASGAQRVETRAPVSPTNLTQFVTRSIDQPVPVTFTPAR